MSASGIEDRKISIDVSRYAPPRYRARAGETTIAPVLERLSRGEPHDDSERSRAQPVPPAEPIHARGASPKIPLSMTGRLAVAMGLLAVLAAVSVTFLQSKDKHPAVTAKKVDAEAAGRNLDVPRTVHTVSIRSGTATVGQTQTSTIAKRPAPAQPAASLADRAAGVAPQNTQPRAAMAPALMSPLKMWAMFPDDASAPASQPTGAPSDTSGNRNGTRDASAKSSTAASHRTAKATRHVQRHKRRVVRHRVHRRSTRTAAAKPQPLERQAVAARPIKKTPIQAALDSIFGNSGNGGDSASDSPSVSAAPASTGAAFR